ncbi:hypothetical protein QBC33DRAFT_235685 [Phialemonium atrogriseum]|uniref:Uncharacterized protein n=1 Tax=Phialemonium atrogriseum TaxID=1093897 RepID=A0AAJ0C9I2_9PEZI|nr:uncharacterized protein QBC33DRAFT_235685 [Phialemonium atrogriseum]KAK1771187.1 hypothetical protein QBC33DRAFT_235685 [Phialemonium atrogriseum]
MSLGHSRKSATTRWIEMRTEGFFFCALCSYDEPCERGLHPAGVRDTRPRFPDSIDTTQQDINHHSCSTHLLVLRVPSTARWVPARGGHTACVPGCSVASHKSLRNPISVITSPSSPQFKSVLDTQGEEGRAIPRRYQRPKSGIGQAEWRRERVRSTQLLLSSSISKLLRGNFTPASEGNARVKTCSAPHSNGIERYLSRPSPHESRSTPTLRKVCLSLCHHPILQTCPTTRQSWGARPCFFFFFFPPIHKPF